MPCPQFSCYLGGSSFFCTRDCLINHEEDGCLKLCEACLNHNSTLGICLLSGEFCLRRELMRITLNRETYDEYFMKAGVVGYDSFCH
jgi:hypothetical protein